MSYIERETALQIIDNYAKAVSEDGKAVVDAIRDIVEVITHAADVVYVVRCKDCVYWTGKDYSGCCIKNGLATRYAKEYCSRGERRFENEG